MIIWTLPWNRGEYSNWPKFHQPWIEQYQQYPNNTLLIANTGLHSEHHNSTEAYQKYFDQFVELARTFSRPKDYIFYRTSVPGHGDCKTNDKPLTSPSNFHVDNTWNWPLIHEFNEYSKQGLSNLTKDAYYWGRINHWMLLDVYPMTILRPDGHLKPPTDCLHYKYLGMHDFWVHLLMNNLMDLSKAKL